MTNTHYDNDELTFLDEDGPQPDHVMPGKFWNVLVVDDDEEIHTVTRLALSQAVISNRQLRFFHAYSASQARTILDQHGSQIALILLDVVLEADDAGLTVVKYLRETLQLEEPRIVLRTGQPGYAPELSIITDYDINDYKTKTELTRSRLLTTVITSIRSYQHIVTINQSRLGLQKIIDASTNLLEEHSIKAFCEGVVIQLSSLLGLEAEGLVCAKAGSLIEKDANTVYVLGAAGDFARLINQPVSQLNNAAIS